MKFGISALPFLVWSVAWNNQQNYIMRPAKTQISLGIHYCCKNIFNATPNEQIEQSRLNALKGTLIWVLLQYILYIHVEKK